MQPFCTGKNLANVTIRCTVFVHLKIVLLKVTSEFSFDLFGQCSRKLNPFSRNCVVMQSLTSGYDNTMAASSFPRSFLLLKRGTWEPGCYGSYSFASSLTSAINGYLPKRPLIIYCPGGGGWEDFGESHDFRGEWSGNQLSCLKRF